MHKPTVVLRLSILIGVALVVMSSYSPAHAIPPARWQKYTLADGRYSILLPGRPDINTRDVPQPPVIVHLKVARYLIPNHAYLVIYMSFTPKRGAPEPIARRFKDFETGLLTGRKKLLRVSDLKLQGYPGKEYRILSWLRSGNKPMTSVCRCYMVGDTMYQLIYQVVGPGSVSKVNSPEATKFLNSFTLLSPAFH
jgi:hypothetical protein